VDLAFARTKEWPNLAATEQFDETDVIQNLNAVRHAKVDNRVVQNVFIVATEKESQPLLGLPSQ